MRNRPGLGFWRGNVCDGTRGRAVTKRWRCCVKINGPPRKVGHRVVTKILEREKRTLGVVLRGVEHGALNRKRTQVQTREENFENSIRFSCFLRFMRASAGGKEGRKWGGVKEGGRETLVFLSQRVIRCPFKCMIQARTNRQQNTRGRTRQKKNQEHCRIVSNEEEKEQKNRGNKIRVNLRILKDNIERLLEKLWK